ncbi:MAG: ABC transporter permease subunit [Xanthomonadales bacterium]|nr:ABC transporter permease subunit [Xanthomonadales bacterium]
MKPAWWTVFRKEVTENLRDRRTVINSLVYGPLFGPFLFVVLIGFVVSQAGDRAERPLELPVAGAELAPNLMAFLRQNNIVIEQAPEDPEQAVRDQDQELVLRVPAEYAERWREGRSAPLELIYDQSRQFTQQSVLRLTRVLDGYGGLHAALRISARGVNPEVMRPLAIVDRDQSSAQSRAGMLLAFLPYMLIIGAFVAGMYLAIDTTAGERERQSLEALLINPVPRSQILIGKLAATTAFALTALALSLLAFLIALPLMPVGQTGLDIQFNVTTAAWAMLAIAPLALLAASSETLVAAFSKSFREAQTWLGMMMVLPAIPAVVLLLNPVKPTAWMYWTPLVSQHVVLNQIVRGELVAGWQFAASIVGTLALGLFLAWLCIRIYHRERLAISV